MDDVSMATEVTGVKNHPNTEMNSNESQEAHGDSDAEEDLKENAVHSSGARSAKREEENRRRTSRNHVCPKLELITRSGETEEHRNEDENKAKIEGTPLMHEAEHPHRRKSSDKPSQKAKSRCGT